MHTSMAEGRQGKQKHKEYAHLSVSSSSSSDNNISPSHYLLSTSLSNSRSTSHSLVAEMASSSVIPRALGIKLVEIEGEEKKEMEVASMFGLYQIM